MKVALYARVSTVDQKTLPMQLEIMKEYCLKRNFEIFIEVSEVASGAKNDRVERKKIIDLAKKRKIDAVIVWKLDRWGRSLNDLISTINELTSLGVGFISITEALDLITPMGKAFAGLLAVFSEFERDLLTERIKAGIVQARKKGKIHGRPATAFEKSDWVIKYFNQGKNLSEISRTLGMSRTSVRRILRANGLML